MLRAALFDLLAIHFANREFIVDTEFRLVSYICISRDGAVTKTEFGDEWGLESCVDSFLQDVQSLDTYFAELARERRIVSSLTLEPRRAVVNFSLGSHKFLTQLVCDQSPYFKTELASASRSLPQALRDELLAYTESLLDQLQQLTSDDKLPPTLYLQRFVAQLQVQSLLAPDGEALPHLAAHFSQQ